MTTSVYSRLHITPLNENLLPIVLGPGLARSAQNISYQTIDTFPENDYGFLDLPEQDAKKLIAKLNGAILKGKRMKIEEARSKKRSSATVDDDEELRAEKPRKKPKKEKNVLEGHELPADRNVKRGWTESKAERSSNKKEKSKDKDKKKSKSQAPSKYTEKEELLFRTKLPPSKEDLSTTKEKSSKRKRTSETIIHEFQKTATQPSFLRDTTSANRAAEYVDSVGWVDESGEVVEKEPSRLRHKRHAKAQSLKINVPSAEQTRTTTAPSAEQLPKVPTSHSSATTASNTNNQVELADDETSGSGSSSTSGSDVGQISAAESMHEADHRESLSRPLQMHASSPPATPPQVHPLEALFKKPKPPTGNDAAKPSLEVETSFSFFGQTPDEDDDLPPMPNTPFTSQDINSRSVRSAAPTPDTAHPSRFSSFASALTARTQDYSDEDEIDEDEEAGGSGRSSQRPDKKVESDFEKRFWAERGPNNRAWKASKRAAMKEERQKQNRLRRPRNR